MSNLELRVVDAAGADAQWCIDEYFALLAATFPEGFDSAHDPVRDRERFGPPSGLFLVAYEGELPVGCGALQALGPVTCEIKRMWVVAPARGRGVGARILAELEKQARRLGYDRVCLDTNDALTPAIAMYRSRGYADIPPYNDNPYAKLWFVKEL